MKQIYACASDIHGMGIRLGEPAERGDIVLQIKGEMKFKVNKSKEDALANPDWVGIAKNQWIDPKKPYKFLNHSCEPNTGIKGKVSLAALRHIDEGEEVTIDYATIEGDPRWEMKCACGAKNCRKIVKSIQFLPEAQYKKYLPFISSYFKRLYQERDTATDGA